MKNNILAGNKKGNPYYIVAPSYISTSAGIKVIHLLCHHLNLMGHDAFIAFWQSDCRVSPGLITPILTDEAIKLHISSGKNPIVIYPDNIKGNPLNASCVVRYLLNYKGLLGGDNNFPKNDLIFSYSKKIAENIGADKNKILFMPISNTDIFYPSKNNIKRIGSCFYASKYQNYHKGKLFNITKNSVEITRDLPNSQTTEEVGDLLRKSEIFYAYEDTSLITEAILCGCPVVVIKNQFFNGIPLAIEELGNEGISLDTNPENIELARNTIPIAQKKFFDAVENFWAQLDNFIKTTQDFSNKVDNQSQKIIFKCDDNRLQNPKKLKRIPIGRILRKELQILLKKCYKFYR